MPIPQKTIAILSANPAFASIFSGAFKDRGFRAVAFSTASAFSTFLRIAPVDVAVLNLDVTWPETIRTVRGLKSIPRAANPLLKAIVLTHDTPFVGSLEGTGVDAVLAKPVTPAQLVLAIWEALEGPQRSAQADPKPATTARRLGFSRAATAPSEPRGNVIPLFGYRPSA